MKEKKLITFELVLSLALVAISYWMITRGMIFWAIINMLWANNMMNPRKSQVITIKK